MRAITLTLIAFATSLSFGIANAEEASDMEVVVVTAKRPDGLETRQDIAVDEAILVIDFSRLTIEAPKLDPSKVRLVPRRIDVALHEEFESKS